MDTGVLRDLVDRQAIVDTVVRWAQALDAKDLQAATCQSATPIHRLDPSRETDNTFDTLAHYTHTLARTPQGWRITRVRQAVAWNRGNPAIHAGARPRPDAPARG